MASINSSTLYYVLSLSADSVKRLSSDVVVGGQRHTGIFHTQARAFGTLDVLVRVPRSFVTAPNRRRFGLEIS